MPDLHELVEAIATEFEHLREAAALGPIEVATEKGSRKPARRRAVARSGQPSQQAS